MNILEKKEGREKEDKNESLQQIIRLVEYLS